MAAILKGELMGNQTDLILTDSEKIKAFDEIAGLFYRRNFGTASKSDIETLMFRIYMRALIANNSDANGVLDYSVCSDYKIGRALGITPQKVNNQKVRTELRYNQPDFDWKKSLRKIIGDEKNIHVKNGDILVNIPDPNLFLAVKDYIEDNSGIVDIQLNGKVLKVSQRDFVVLITELSRENEEEFGAICKALNDELKKEGRQERIKKTMGINDMAGIIGLIANICSIAGMFVKNAI
ncbi:MAG: hypothetical protein NC078_09415 [Ruminococcus sp.]|nr:hypothetical protein [Ruminococcus sp.]